MKSAIRRIDQIRRLIIPRRPLIVGMIHVDALPGTPQSKSTIDQLVDKACQEAQIYSNARIDAIMLENMHDTPYVSVEKVGPEITATMTRLCTEVSRLFASTDRRPLLGLQILAGANRQALATALASGFDFIRVEGFVFAHVADEGLMNACAGDLLRYRRHIGADHIAILADIKKKHCSHSITSDLSIDDVADAAEFFGANGIVITGSATGRPANPHELIAVKSHSQLPVFIGSGITFDNIGDFIKADGFIVGSHFKENGRWDGNLDELKVKRFMDRVEFLSKSTIV